MGTGRQKEEKMIKLLHGDCLKVLRTLADNSVDSIVTDPPYGLSFMNKKWDYDVPSVEVWKECLRVLKPGGHLLCFAGTRTQHRMCVNIEDAGFAVRDLIAWVYGTGFPKNRKLPAGWGTALKPAMELITLARKPFKGAVAPNVLEHGTGGINIDACRIHSGPSSGGSISGATALGQSSGWNAHVNRTTQIDRSMSKGRFPANVIFDEEAASVLDEQRDGSSRFFYCAKASKRDRTENNTVENSHPTVKPTKLMQYLCKLATPEGGTVLDPFAGSGSTGKAARLEGFNAILVEVEEEYIKIAEERLGERRCNPQGEEDERGD